MGSARYDRVQYQPPIPQVFGASGGSEMELPRYDPGKSQSSGYYNNNSIPESPLNRNLPASKMKLKDRLALYEEDDPTTMRWICLLGELEFLILRHHENAQ